MTPTHHRDFDAVVHAVWSHYPVEPLTFMVCGLWLRSHPELYTHAPTTCLWCVTGLRYY